MSQVRTRAYLLALSLVTSIGFAGLVPAAALAEAAKSCERSVDPDASLQSSGFSFNQANTRNQSSAITAANVAELSVGFTHAAVGATGKRGAPAVKGEAIYFTAGRRLLAMDRSRGCLFWSFTVDNARLGFGLGRNLLRSASVLLVEPGGPQVASVIVGDARGQVYALDAVSGQLRWSRFAGTMQRYHWITGGMQYADGKVLVPLASREVIVTPTELDRPCCSSHGLLTAIDVRTGDVEWRYHTTPPAKLNARQFAKTLTMGPSGAGIWGAPAVDLQRRTVYLGTGQNYSPPQTKTSDAIIAVDLDTGEQQWVFQATEHDVWNAACELRLTFKCPAPVGHDFDFGAPPLLTTLPDGRDAVLGADKGGVVWCLDAESGALIWSRRIGKGSALGGIHWGIAADTNRVYAAVADTFANKSAVLISDTGLNVTVKPVKDGTPGIYALDLQTGREAWSVQPTHLYNRRQYISVYSAAVSVTNDVLFAGALDGELAAFHTSDGRELWRFDSDIPVTDLAGNKGDGGTIDSVGAVPVGDSVYLNSGYDNFGGVDAYQAGRGNVLFGFRLPRGR